MALSCDLKNEIHRQEGESKVTKLLNAKKVELPQGEGPQDKVAHWYLLSRGLRGIVRGESGDIGAHRLEVFKEWVFESSHTRTPAVHEPLFNQGVDRALLCSRAWLRVLVQTFRLSGVTGHQRLLHF